MPPVYVSVSVRLSLTLLKGVDRDATLADAEARLREWMNPNDWARPTLADDTMAVEDKVRIYEVIEYVNRAEGVWYVVDGTVELSLDKVAWQNTDLTLPGPLPIVTADEITLTVVET